MIPEPQRTYVLELFHALGPAGHEFVIAGAQAIKFVVERARATKDIDFILDVERLWGEGVAIGAKLNELGFRTLRTFGCEPNGPEVIYRLWQASTSKIAKRARGKSGAHSVEYGS